MIHAIQAFDEAPKWSSDPSRHCAGSDWSGTEAGLGDSLGAGSAAPDSSEYGSAGHHERQAMLTESAELLVRAPSPHLLALITSTHLDTVGADCCISSDAGDWHAQKFIAQLSCIQSFSCSGTDNPGVQS